MKRVAVLMGGPSSEHDVSVLSGLNVIRALAGLPQYQAVPIYITNNGAWLVGDERVWMNPGDALRAVDVAFNALHGEYGEDGKVQHILGHHQIPYTGSEALASSIAMNKVLAQKILESEGVRMPRSLVLGAHNLDTRTVLAFAPAPWIVKPVSRGSSVGVSKVRSHAELPAAFQKALQYDSKLIVQEYISGREITCGVIEGHGGEDVRALPPVEIIPPEGADFFDYQVKYNGQTQELCPADFHGAMLKLIQDTAKKVHRILGFRHYSRTDMILKPSDQTRRAPELYVLEANTLPGLTGESLLPKSARAIGIEFPDLVSHLIERAHMV